MDERICSHFAPVTPPNRTKQGEGPRTIRSVELGRRNTLFPRDQRVTDYGRLTLKNPEGRLTPVLERRRPKEPAVVAASWVRGGASVRPCR
jgi:hypothetical protein